MLPGSDGAGKAYPGRLEEVLRKRYPHVEIKVTALAKSRQSAADMAQNLEKALLDRKPDLVIWQTGTVDAMRGVDPESFRASLDDGIDHIVDTGADLILMNMQYSPRTETMISLSNYADIMRVVARDRDVPLFDRREIMSLIRGYYGIRDPQLQADILRLISKLGNREALELQPQH